MDWFKRIKKYKTFFQKKETFWGLDILHANSLSCVSVAKKGGDVFVQELEVIDFQNRIASHKSLKKNPPFVSLSREEMIVRLFKISAHEDDQAAENIIMRQEKTLPFLLKNLCWSYVIFKETGQNNTILFCGIEKQKIVDYQNTLSKLGITNFYLTVSTVAIVNCFLFNYGEGLFNRTVLLLHINKDNIEIIIIRGETIVLTKSIRIGILYLTRLFSEKASLDFNTAQDIILLSSQNDVAVQEDDSSEKKNLKDYELQLKESFQIWFKDIVRHIDLARRFYKIKENQSIDNIFVSKVFFNSGYNEPYIVDFIQTEFKIKTEFWNPIEKIKIETQNETKKKQSNRNEYDFGQLVVSLGLALHNLGKGKCSFVMQQQVQQNMNMKWKKIFALFFQKRKQQPKQKTKQERKQLFFFIGIICICFVGLFCYKSYSYIQILERKEKKLKIRLTTLRKEKDLIVKSIEKVSQHLQKIQLEDSVFLDTYLYFSKFYKKRLTVVPNRYVFSRNKVDIFQSDYQERTSVETVILQ